MTIKLHDYVQCCAVQIAECPLHVGGVYQVISITETGNLALLQCGRGHDPIGFELVPKAVQSKFKHGDSVQLKPDNLIVDHKCSLEKERIYRVGSVDDFNRIFFHHQGCDNWHDPEDLVDASVEQPITFGKLVNSIRLSEKLSVGELAEKLDDGKPEILTQVEHRHFLITLISAVEAGTDAPHIAAVARWAIKLGYPPEQFIKLAIQQQIDAADLKLKVEISKP